MELKLELDLGGSDINVPLLVCFAAFVVTFLTTRTITRMIRAGKGPFHDNVSGSGVHIHHAVPGIILLVIGAFVAVGTNGTDSAWTIVAAVLVGVGTSSNTNCPPYSNTLTAFMRSLLVHSDACGGVPNRGVS